MNLNGFYETDRLILRPFIEKDSRIDWMHDPEVTKYNSHGLFPYTEEKRKIYNYTMVA